MKTRRPKFALQKKIEELMKVSKPIRHHISHDGKEIVQNLLLLRKYRILGNNDRIIVYSFEEIDEILESLLKYHKDFWTYLRHLFLVILYQHSEGFPKDMTLDKWLLFHTLI